METKEEKRDISLSPTPQPETPRVKALRCRDLALLELVNTEKTYVNGLGKLIIIYMNPLKQDNYSIIPISDHQTIFPSVINTIYNLHNQLLAELDYNYHHYPIDEHNNNESITSRIGKVLLKYAELFKMYQIYMNGYERATKSLQIIKRKNRRFTKWLQSQCIKTSLSAGDLESLLILPIQRIPRYQLLLKEIIKQSKRICVADHGLNDLQNAYEQILEITKLIERKMKEYDNRSKVALIEKKFSNINPGDLVTPSRYYITESKPKNIRLHHQDGSSFDIILILFNDCMIYGHFNEDIVSSGRGYWSGTLSSKLYLDHTLTFDHLFHVEKEDNYKNLYCLKVYSRQYSIWISFKSRKLRAKWVKQINEANNLVNNSYLVNVQRFNGVYNDKQTIPYPCFVPDDYSETCQQCGILFTFTQRKHHCRQCGRLLCRDCTNYRINSVFFNKSKKNTIIRCCKKCKHGNTFSMLNKPNKDLKIKKKKNTSLKHRYGPTTKLQASASAGPPGRDNKKMNTVQTRERNGTQYHPYDHGYDRHVEIYNRINRSKTSPNPKSPPLQTLNNNTNIRNRASTPPMLNSSCTSTISMRQKSPSLKSRKPSIIRSIVPQQQQRKHSNSKKQRKGSSSKKHQKPQRKLSGSKKKREKLKPIKPTHDQTLSAGDVILENVEQTPLRKPTNIPCIDSISTESEKIRTKYMDKMPQSPHLNPPKDDGYNNDDIDSMDEELEDDEDSSTEMPILDLLSVARARKTSGHRRVNTAPVPNINIIERRVSASSQPKSHRSRSYAFGLLDEVKESQWVGCVITDDDATTDGETYQGQAFIDQLILDLDGMDGMESLELPSSADSKGSFRKSRVLHNMRVVAESFD